MKYILATLCNARDKEEAIAFERRKEQPNSMLNDYITPTNFSANVRQINKTGTSRPRANTKHNKNDAQAKREREKNIHIYHLFV